MTYSVCSTKDDTLEVAAEFPTFEEALAERDRLWGETSLPIYFVVEGDPADYVPALETDPRRGSRFD